VGRPRRSPASTASSSGSGAWSLRPEDLTALASTPEIRPFRPGSVLFGSGEPTPWCVAQRLAANQARIPALLGGSLAA
jgi:hypothetical protein